MSATISKKCENCPYPQACKYGTFAVIALVAYKTIAIIPSAYRYISKRLYKQLSSSPSSVPSSTQVETTTEETELKTLNVDAQVDIESNL